MASHGVDQLMVQRLLACRTVRDSQKAVIASGVVVFIQFALFLIVGVMLWSFYGGADPEALGLGQGDEIFSQFIVNEMPSGLAGLLIALIMMLIAVSLSTVLAAWWLGQRRNRQRLPEGDPDSRPVMLQV